MRQELQDSRRQLLELQQSVAEATRRRGQETLGSEDGGPLILNYISSYKKNGLIHVYVIIGIDCIC